MRVHATFSAGGGFTCQILLKLSVLRLHDERATYSSVNGTIVCLNFRVGNRCFCPVSGKRMVLQGSTGFRCPHSNEAAQIEILALL